jgi:di/tripeptidase
LVLVANVGEEGEGNLSGMRYLCESREFASEVRAFLVLDGPSTEHITSHAIASQRLEVVIKGPGGHSWSDFGTANPVHALSHAINHFSTAVQDSGAGKARSSFNFGLIEGGLSINSIPDSALAKIDLRSEDQNRIREMSALLSESVEEAMQKENSGAIRGRLTARIRELGSRPAGRLPEHAPLLQCVQAVDAHLGIRARTNSASTDANVPLSLGLEALSIGAGGSGGGAHTTKEWFDPRGREIGLRRIILTLALLASL